MLLGSKSSNIKKALFVLVALLSQCCVILIPHVYIYVKIHVFIACVF